MKKIISLALVLLMILGCVGTSYAAVSPNGISADGWNGWSGNATTVTDATKGMVMKITGNAVMNPACSFRGVIMLTVDVKAEDGGTITLADEAGHIAGTITLANGKINGGEAYGTSDWNTLKLFVLSGISKYEVYLSNGSTDTLAATGDLAENVIPTCVKFNTTGTMYVDNVTIEEMHKAAPYPEKDLKNNYTMDLAEGTKGASIHNINGWTVSNSDVSFDARNVNYLVDEIDNEKVIKLAKTNAVTNASGDTISRSINHLKHSISTSNNIVIEASIYSEAGNDSSFKWLIDDINLFTMKNGEIVFGTPVFTKANVYEENTWVDIRVELMKETQSMNFYIGEDKINDVPVYLDEFSSFKTLDLYVNPAATAQGVWYLKDLKISELAEKNNIVAFSENFNGTENTLRHAGSTSYLSLKNTASIFDTSTGDKSGRLQDYSYITDNNVITDDAGNKLTEEDGIIDLGSTGNNEYIYAPVDLSDAEKVVVEFSWYNAQNAHQSTATGTVRDRLYWGLGTDGEINYGALMEPTKMSITGSKLTAGDTSNHAAFKASKTDVTEMSVTYDASAKYPMAVYGDTDSSTQTKNYTKGTINLTDLQSQDELIFYLHKNYGGAYYLDDITVTKTVTVLTQDYYKKTYTTPKYTYIDTITREDLPEIALSEVVFKDASGNEAGIPQANGIVSKVKIEKNADLTGKNILVAVYDEDALSDCAILAVTNETEYDLTANDVKTTASSVVKVFCLESNTLVPQMEAKSVDKDKRVKIFLAGDSIVEDYTGKEGQFPGRKSWGMSLTEMINGNFAEVRNYAHSGETAKSFLDYEGYTKIANEIGAGDYLLISFGTNDSEYGSSVDNPYGTIYDGKSFQYYLYEKYIKLATDNGATPILVTTNPRSQDGNYADGRYKRGPGVYVYVQAMRELAEKHDVEIVDLYAMSVDHLDKIGFDEAKKLYVASLVDESSEYSTDFTHLSEAGGDLAASFVVQGLKLIDGIKDLVK